MAKAELTIEIRDLEEVKNELKAKDQRIAELEEQLKSAIRFKTPYVERFAVVVAGNWADSYSYSLNKDYSCNS